MLKFIPKFKLQTMKSEFLAAHGKILLVIYSNEGCIVKEALERSCLVPNTFYTAKEC